MDHLLLTFDPLEINKINDLVADDACGAISYFVGTTRDNFEAKKVLSLEYEAYEPMALKEMNAICKELRVRWPDIVNIAIYHRLGLVKVREASVIIAISSPHRKTALDATTSAIEELKRRVPIWKKEKYCNDESAWKENKECAWISPGTRNLKRQLDFSAIKCPINNKRNVTDLVQISAPETEIARRIDSFVKKKREEIDLSNAMDFVSKSSTAEQLEDRTSCARTDSILIKQEQSGKGHLRVRHAARADCGPQTRRADYLEAIDKHMSTSKLKDANSKHSKFASSNERIHNIETFLGLPALNSQSILQRLKAIENRILFLETVSPEYKHFLNGGSNELANANNEQHASEDVKPTLTHRKTYSIAQLDALISEYEDEKP